ncbi:CCA tRNA nucleotidyltransferase [Mesorhizobium sp. BR1-1-16]|uniref:CCA tRNA nucleotidyltransferase n=1 Tax=Mesorhizobium sp. BR1-1-16 TaxID=2876653 RepID=UPI001CCD1102|nr:CCA tRNA nucleotidyltransferase [Mesorhizobium sp. BR1-1-16]MBZ9936455.1 CCA tRNA nucleotidyltransferase [Mesorhizobium sp. BR1-1-16]
MTTTSLAGASFLSDPLVVDVLRLLSADGGEARVIGGAVRNELMGQPVTGDIDIATTLEPDEVLARAAAAGMQSAPTGIEHGTVTLIGRHRVVEVTTLREDIETDGRHAVVRFGTDWAADAARRDFTINALSVDAAGHLYDTVGGLTDIAARRVRFIGAADQRIAEDRLRVLRFFRFHASYGSGAPDAEGLSAAIRARHDLGGLSAERVGQEMRKLVMAVGAAPTLRAMQEGGILPLVAAGVGDLGSFERLVADAAAPDDASLRFAVLLVRVQEDVDRTVRRFRLSNRERDRMTDVLAAAEQLVHGTIIGDRVAVYRRGREAVLGGLTLLAARNRLPAAEIAARRDAVTAFTPPVFPLGGRDVVDLGVGRGPAVGVILRDLERWWLAEDFRPDETALRRRLQSMIAAQQ